MTLDFDRIREIYKRRIEPLCDHQYLNETVPVARTTAELLAAWILGEMRADLPQVVAVRVSETRSSWAEVTVDDLDASEA
jgi:6-pyruvoyltetrahydropterin/6-carboxytetrahydropterin synthase